LFTKHTTTRKRKPANLAENVESAGIAIDGFRQDSAVEVGTGHPVTTVTMREVSVRTQLAHMFYVASCENIPRFQITVDIVFCDTLANDFTAFLKDVSDK